MTANKLNITLVQTDIVWEDYNKNLQGLETKLQELKPQSLKKQASETNDLVILPEMFTTGFSMEPRPIAQKMDGPAVSWMQDMAAKHHIDLMGSMIIEDKGRYYNRLVWSKSDGTIFTYDKKHLFSFAGEHEKYSAGNKQLVVELNGWKIATFICYDLRFPCWSRNIGARYDVAVYIASWPQRRAEHWKALLRARAIENQAYVIGLNRVGTDGNDINYSGDSMIFDPLGEVLFHSNYEQLLYNHCLEKDHLDSVRESFPFLKDADIFELIG